MFKLYYAANRYQQLTLHSEYSDREQAKQEFNKLCSDWQTSTCKVELFENDSSIAIYDASALCSVIGD